MSPDMPRETARPTIYVDERPLHATGRRMTGAEILAEVGLPPEEYDLYATGHHGVRIPPEQDIEVREGARFMTRPHE